MKYLIHNTNIYGSNTLILNGSNYIINNEIYSDLTEAIDRYYNIIIDHNHLKYYTLEEARIDEIEIEHYVGDNYVYDHDYKLIYVLENNDDNIMSYFSTDAFKLLVRKHYINSIEKEIMKMII